MSSLKIVTRLSAALSTLNGLIIIGNDVMVGVRNPQPVVSLVVGFIFCAIGFLIWQIGHKLFELRLHIRPEAVHTYRMLSVYLNVVLVAYGIVMLSVVYALGNRIEQGHSIFG